MQVYGGHLEFDGATILECFWTFVIQWPNSSQYWIFQFVTCRISAINGRIVYGNRKVWTKFAQYYLNWQWLWTAWYVWRQRISFYSCCANSKQLLCGFMVDLIKVVGNQCWLQFLLNIRYTVSKFYRIINKSHFASTFWHDMQTESYSWLNAVFQNVEGTNTRSDVTPFLFRYHGAMHICGTLSLYSFAWENTKITKYKKITCIKFYHVTVHCVLLM